MGMIPYLLFSVSFMVQLDLAIVLCSTTAMGKYQIKEREVDVGYTYRSSYSNSNPNRNSRSHVYPSIAGGSQTQKDNAHTQKAHLPPCISMTHVATGERPLFCSNQLYLAVKS